MEEAVTRLREYIRIDTTNPPGNESQTVEFLAGILDAEGIPYDTAESAPGRGNIWARLKGGPEPGLILLSHMDVVPADAEFWSVPPFSGEIHDGYIYGRGTLDMKSMGIFELQAFLALHRSGKPLNRDLIFLATADEEAGGMYGAGWMAKNRRDVLEGAGLLINEGGGGRIEEGKCVFGIEVTQKVPLWLRLAITGNPGHGSAPRANEETAVPRLIRAVHRVLEYPFPPRITAAVDTYFKALAQHVEKPWREAFADMRSAVNDPAFLAELQTFNPGFHSLTRNTCSITRLEGSSKINVVPTRATAELDCRLLPDQDPAEFVNTLRFVIDDPAIEIEEIMLFSPAESPTDSELYRAIETVCHRHYPDAAVIPSVMTGFTDSHFFRDLGIDCYGFQPGMTPIEEFRGIHGNDERISLENVKLGTQLMLEILQEVLY